MTPHWVAAEKNSADSALVDRPSPRRANHRDLGASWAKRRDLSDGYSLHTHSHLKHPQKEELKRSRVFCSSSFLNYYIYPCNVVSLTIFVVVHDKILPIRNRRGVVPRCEA